MQKPSFDEIHNEIIETTNVDNNIKDIVKATINVSINVSSRSFFNFENEIFNVHIGIQPRICVN